MCDALLTVADAHLDAELLVDVLRQMLGGIDRAVLTTRTAEGEHQRGEATLDIAAHMSIGQLIDGVEEGEDLTVVLQESDDRLVESCEFLIGFITARVMGASAVEHIAATVATLILGDALAVGETKNLHHQRSLCIVFREGGGTILGMGLVGIEVGGLIAVGTTGNGLNLLELREFCQFLKDLHQMGIVE